MASPLIPTGGCRATAASDPLVVSPCCYPEHRAKGRRTSTRKGDRNMKLQQVSDHWYAVLNEANWVCDANSGLVNLGAACWSTPQSYLAHARQMIELVSKVWSGMPRYVALTHEDIDHVTGNQLFADAEIIAQRTMPGRVKLAANPEDNQHLLHAVAEPPTREVLKAAHPGLLAAGSQLREATTSAGSGWSC